MCLYLFFVVLVYLVQMSQSVLQTDWSVLQMSQSVLQMSQSVLQMAIEYHRLMLAPQEVALVAATARPTQLCQQDRTGHHTHFV